MPNSPVVRVPGERFVRLSSRENDARATAGMGDGKVSLVLLFLYPAIVKQGRAKVELTAEDGSHPVPRCRKINGLASTFYSKLVFKRT